MRVVLTGSAGFIGQAVLRVLTAGDHEVVGVDLRPTPGDAATAHRVDVRDEGALAGVLRGADAVCHQAAKVGLERSAHDAPAYADTNTTGTATLLSAMARADVGHLVQASSMVVYGGGRSVCAEHGEVRPRPRTREDLDAGRFDPLCPECGAPTSWALVTEDARLDPRNAYAATKLSQEHLATAWAERTGGRAVSLRYHNVYGPGLPADTPYAGVAALFAQSLARGEAPRVYEDGRQMRDFVHVADVARANARALESLAGAPLRGEAGSGDEHAAFNVASGRPRSVLDLAAALSGAVGGPAPVVVGGGRPGDVRHVVADPARAARQLGFTAEIALEDGVGDVLLRPG